LIFYVLSSLMVAEERITTKFSGLVGAYGNEEEATFLSTQQVDEARPPLILEATLGLTTFKFTTDYLSAEGLLPGFVEGYSKIHHDETRHIGYGVWFLRETVREKPEMADVVRATLRELLPSVAASLAPPDSGSDRDFAAIGASSEDIRAFALGGLTRR